MDNDDKKLLNWMFKAFPAFWTGELFIFLLLITFGGKWEKTLNSDHDMIWQFFPDSRIIGIAFIVSLLMGLSIIFYARKK